MKRSITFIFISLIMPAVSEIAQPVLPTFLEGIWKKGFAYVMKKK